MKKSLRFILAAATVSMMGVAFAAEPSADALAGAKGIDADETGAYLDFSTAEIKGWSKDGGKKYVTQDDKWAKFQDASGNECTKVATVVDTGDGDKAVSIDLNLEKRSANATFLFNYSNQGADKKDLSATVAKIRIYIPASMVADGMKDYPTIKFVARDGNWGMSSLGKEIDAVTVKDIGAGWHTLVIDFANNTFDFGAVKGAIKPNKAAVKNSASFDMTFVSKKLDASQAAETFLVDYVRFDGIK